MRDYSSAYPEHDLIEVYVSTTSDQIIKTQAYWSGEGLQRRMYSPELTGTLYEHYTSFEDAKTAMIARSERTIAYIEEKLVKLRALEDPSPPSSDIGEPNERG